MSSAKPPAGSDRSSPPSGERPLSGPRAVTPSGKPPIPIRASRPPATPPPAQPTPALVDDSSGAPVSGRESRPSGEFSAGVLIGQKYRLVRCLGHGGMASVWVAHNEALDIHVAIKFIRADLAQTQLADRLLQEARAAARLGHPAIVRVSDFGKTRRGDPYIVMELLSGEDLGTALERRGRLPAVKAVRTLLPIAHALGTAHDKGIVHRDLKPENVFLAQTEDGNVQPKLVDFGIAKLENENFARLTDMGTALGSPGYMSPEQARGQDVDHRSDVWALCVVLYESMTGRLPFDGKSYNALLRSIIEDTPAPITNFAAGDQDLWAVLEKGFEKDPDRRWQNMREIGAALARWLVQRNVQEDIAGASLQAAWFQWRKSGAPSMPPPSSGEGSPRDHMPDTQSGPTYSPWPPPPSQPPAGGPASLPGSVPPLGFGSQPPSGRPSLLDVASAGPASRAWRAIVVGLAGALLLVVVVIAVLLSRSSGPAAEPARPAAAPAAVPAQRQVEGASESIAVRPVGEGETAATPPSASASGAPSASVAPRATSRPAERKASKPAKKGDLDIKTTF